MYKLFFFIGLFHCSLFSIFGQNNEVFQYSTSIALAEGEFDGDFSVGQLLKYGNFGLGTFNALNGELMIIGGKCYRAKADSLNGFQIKVIKNEELVPFAVVVDFNSDSCITFSRVASVLELDSLIDTLIPSENFIYAIKVEAFFPQITCRSVSIQNKPYSRLIEVVRHQKIWNFSNKDGSLIGFRFPNYMKDLNVPGYHWHFISKDKKNGGHVIDFNCDHLRIDIVIGKSFKMIFPSNQNFIKQKLIGNAKEIDIIEKK